MNDTQSITSEITTLVGAAGLTAGVLLEHLGVPAAQEDALIAGTLGLTPAQLTELRAGFRQALERTADELLADPSFVAELDRLPFTAGERIVVAGDSLTAAANSWANILQVLLGRRDIELVNRAVSGRSSTDTIAVFGYSLALDPDWILLMLGANDVRRHGTKAGVRMLSLDESVRNLGELGRMAREESRAKVVTLPDYPHIDESKVEANRAAGTFWLSEDLAEANKAVVAAVPGAIDIRSAVQPDGDYWGPDGIHPSPQGQLVLLRVIVQSLGRVER